MGESEHKKLKCAYPFRVFFQLVATDISRRKQRQDYRREVIANGDSKFMDRLRPLKTRDALNCDLPVAYRETHRVNGHLCLYRWLC